MNSAGIDANAHGTWRAYNETTGGVEPVRVDPVLNAILVFNVGNSGGASTTQHTAAIDENDNATLLAYNETTGLQEAVRCNSDGALLTLLV